MYNQLPRYMGNNICVPDICEYVYGSIQKLFLGVLIVSIPINIRNNHHTSSNLSNNSKKQQYAHCSFKFEFSIILKFFKL